MGEVVWSMRFSEVFSYSHMLISGLIVSIWVCIVSAGIGFALALVCAEARSSSRLMIRAPVVWYVETIRNTPFIVQLFFIYFGIAALGLRLNPSAAAIAALSLNIGAYFTEIVRGGLENSRRGISEAARAQGMTPLQVYWRILLPPALAKVDRLLVGQFVLVFLGSAVISQIAVEDLTYAGQFIQTRTFRAFESYLVITVMYAAAGIAFATVYALIRPFLFPWERDVRR
ncbi:amino acid ABC transporter permease [Mesorhizobium sp. J428]|uniref:amino acid ABC transporter permease n=1 Tax=Mesorhizobium sp. J428 TaxID=2898440 RepID=UPI002151EF6E|nr:amino acid ABC transporter permease [Mesorhizobium sp. J428]MCR5858026.1 amino acid ABC transporter permease [Mesorhizobium sp. J428]